MDTAAAAREAGVTAATIRTWIKAGAIAATKAGGRWVVERATLIRRIAIGNKHLLGRAADIRRHEVSTRAMDRSRDGWHEARVDGTRVAVVPTREDAELAIARWTPPRPYTPPAPPAPAAPARGWSKASRARTGGGLVHREMAALTGSPSPVRPGTCHFCGLGAATCDCH